MATVIGLVAAVTFIIAGLRLTWVRRVEFHLLLAVTLFSLALYILGLPQAIVGVRIGVEVLAGLAVVLATRVWRAA